MRIVRIGRSARPRHEAGIRALEEDAEYPLGDDRFRIDHGRDYFAFFDRLGDAVFYAAIDDNRIVAAAAAVLRRVPLRRGGTPRRAWYLCDLKVHPDHRGRNLPLRLLSRAFPRNWLRCPRGYAISMDSPGQRRNRVQLLLSRFRYAKSSSPGTLAIYSLNADAFASARGLIEAHRGRVSLLSLAGVKDIVLASTGGPMPLLHVQFGPCAAPGPRDAVDGATHMLPCPAGDELDRALRGRGLSPAASATIIQHRMGAADWRFVLSSDI